MPVTARIIRIGNSRGLRIPKALLNQADLPDEVELRAEPGKLTATAVRRPRSGWAEAARRMPASDEDRPLDPEMPSAFDEQDWHW